jgi:hypothetical protein
MAACVVEQSGVRAGDAKQTTDGPFTNNEGTRRSRYLGPLEHRHRPPSPPTPPTAPACIVLPCAGCCAAGSYAEASGREGAVVQCSVFVHVRAKAGCVAGSAGGRRVEGRHAGPDVRERERRETFALTPRLELGSWPWCTKRAGAAEGRQDRSGWEGGRGPEPTAELLRLHRLYLDCQTKLDGFSIKTALLSRTFKFRVSLRMFCLLGLPVDGRMRSHSSSRVKPVLCNIRREKVHAY